MNLLNFKKKIKKASIDNIGVKTIHVKTNDPELGQIEYYKTSPKNYEVRPCGCSKPLGSIVEIMGCFLLADEPDGNEYPSLEEGIHALVKKHDKCEIKENMSIFAGKKDLHTFEIERKH